MCNALFFSSSKHSLCIDKLVNLQNNIFLFLGSTIKNILINYWENSLIPVHVIQNNMVFKTTDILQHIFIWIIKQVYTFDGFIPHLLYCIFNVLRLCRHNGDPPLVPHHSHMREVCFVVTFMKTPAVAETLESCYLEWTIIPAVEVFSQRRLGRRGTSSFPTPQQERKSLSEPVIGSWQRTPLYNLEILSQWGKATSEERRQFIHCMKFS